MIFHKSRIKTNSIGTILLDNAKLIKVDYVKYLGVIIDHKLNWIEHIAYVKNKISKGIGIMYKARQYLSKCTLLNLCNVLRYESQGTLGFEVNAWPVADGSLYLKK